MTTQWQFWIDRGGTFTDLVGRAPTGELVVRKVLSEPAIDRGDPAVCAIREVMGLSAAAQIPPGLIQEVRLGTTVATNALLEGAGEPVLLITNQGLADLLLIGDQHRPDLFALEIPAPQSLAVAVVESRGRLNADGEEVEPLCLDAELETTLRAYRSSGIHACAIALMHAWREPCHERRLAELAQTIGFTTVVCSHQVSPLPRLVPRSQTSVVEAAVEQVLFRYLQQVRQSLGGQARLRVMSSSGALQGLEQLLAKDTILSGPAGGMVGAVAAAEAAGLAGQALVGVDMGGTSTDVFCLPAGASDQDWERSAETKIAGLELTAARLPIHTVAAGGGSIIRSDGDGLQVGPRSAGASPGPACYRHGGPLTITDAHLFLGRLQVEAFPPVFGPAGDLPPDLEVVQQRFGELACRLGCDLESLAEGALDLAVETMAGAIQQVSLLRGHDIRAGALVSYGGASGQLACRVAQVLGLRQVLIHPLAGVLSAFGLGQARLREWRQVVVRRPLETDLLVSLPGRIRQELAVAEEKLQAAGAGHASLWEHRIRLELREASSEQGLLIPITDLTSTLQRSQLEGAFDQAHCQRFGYKPPRTTALMLERLEVEVFTAPAPIQHDTQMASATQPVSGALSTTATIHWAGLGWQEVPVVQRCDALLRKPLLGPALILDATGCTVLEPGWSACCDSAGSLLLTAAELPVQRSARDQVVDVPDPVDLSLFHHRFMVIAEQMGERLRQTSRSVNIRERLDFSCALFDQDGALVANAPHIPVHLGSMGEAVVDLLHQIQRGERPPLEPGETVLSNDPYHGGTHLPDITAMTPVFGEGERPSYYVACRGHHADVGGLTPGSMPPFSREIGEEGLRLRNWSLLRGGVLDVDGWNAILRAERQPPRSPDVLWADLQAQVAANLLGVDRLETLMLREGPRRVSRYMRFVQTHAAEAVRRVISRLADQQFSVELDHGGRLQLALHVDHKARTACLDFTGTSPQGDHNFHAPLAVTKAAVLYVLRCLVDESIPLNAGCFEPLTLIVPQGSLLNPLPPAAVVAGNVETSQALCNLLFAAMGVMAAAQGTMNNLTFGDEHSQYYETIAGGGGAGPGFQGSFGVQTHMTNSRLTDPEILEQRFPVRLERFQLRRGSGGKGRWSGGDGLEREICFLAPMTVALLSGSRRVAPFGLAGGEAGALGMACLREEGGPWRNQPGCFEQSVQTGERLWIATPGGGGWGMVERTL
ncbi:5-oxoprolinase (ATP-hydrolysing) [Synechococcus sp. SYN20]|uniref:hydantoinase B/oxoprolinase family protein n=1 Tax=Synechococcus sp. SYN20 TaxID=1050714 RepID=UPI0016470208|nr:hydantoinase B/oxoprolinase family protein [Synechococcus sp. SYN20]QNJ27054.1 5-oxoprolinase (ATP-hydrolysing) [Synechococcus sp. SYN20]